MITDPVTVDGQPLALTGLTFHVTRINPCPDFPFTIKGFLSKRPKGTPTDNFFGFLFNSSAVLLLRAFLSRSADVCYCGELLVLNVKRDRDELREDKNEGNQWSVHFNSKYNI